MTRSNTKKKPNSLILGRVFNGKVLDMVDFEIVYFEEINEGKVDRILSVMEQDLVRQLPLRDFPGRRLRV